MLYILVCFINIKYLTVYYIASYKVSYVVSQIVSYIVPSSTFYRPRKTQRRRIKADIYPQGGEDNRKELRLEVGQSLCICISRNCMGTCRWATLSLGHFRVQGLGD